jgi:DNA-binding PadR family transcriptional regulator
MTSKNLAIHLLSKQETHKYEKIPTITLKHHGNWIVFM